MWPVSVKNGYLAGTRHMQSLTDGPDRDSFNRRRQSRWTAVIRFFKDETLRLSTIREGCSILWLIPMPHRF